MRSLMTILILTLVSVLSAADCDQLLAELDQQITADERRAQSLARSAVAHDRVAACYLNRFRLGGRWEDLGRAQDAVARSRSAGGGDAVLEARIAAAHHRFDEAHEALDRAAAAVLVSDRRRAAIACLRGELALAAQQPEHAERCYRDAITFSDSPAARAGLALAMAVNEPGRADRLLVEAQKRALPGDAQTQAWLHLQRGLLDLNHQDLSAADEHFRTAEAALPGWWLVLEHRAEILALRGDCAAAADYYRRVVAITARPNFMEALADCLASDDPTGAAGWRLAAARRWQELAERVPIALEHARGHQHGDGLHAP